MLQIPGLPYVNPLLGNLLYLMSGQAMEHSIEYEIFRLFVYSCEISFLPSVIWLQSGNCIQSIKSLFQILTPGKAS